MAHRDTPFNTKLLQVRSPLESYERRDLYGKDFQDWATPWESFIVPTYESFVHKNPIISTVSGVILGSLFGTTKLGRLIGATLGGGILGGSSLVRAGWEAVTGETWIPDRRKEQWDINEYFDILEYIKNQRLFEITAQEAKEKEDFDIRQYLSETQAKRDARLKEKAELTKKKREIKASLKDYSDREAKKIAKELGLELDPGDKDKKTKEVSPGQKLLKAINRRITELSVAEKPPENLGPLSMQALTYYNAAKSTMYGSSQGDPLRNIISSLPKTERQYLPYFVDAPPEERAKILAETPPYLRRILEQMWGLKVEDKPDLTEYFRNHILPGADWEGWRPDINLKDVKVKFIKHEGKDPSDFDLWNSDINQAALNKTPVPKMKGHNSPEEIKRTLENLLTHEGFENLQVSIEETNDKRIQIDMEIAKDRRNELRDYANNNAEEIFY